MRAFFALLVVAVAAISSSEAQQVCIQGVYDNCHTRRYKPGKSTACIPYFNPNYRCAAIKSDSKGDLKFQQAMVNAHNKYRRTAYKNTNIYGADMLEVSWDDELAKTALIWAHQLCANKEFKHDVCRSTPNYDSVGQNLMAGEGHSWGGTIDADAMAVKPWYDEMDDTVYNDLVKSGQSKKMIGHYTQVMWAKTHKIGCAYLTKKHHDSRYGYRGWIACNYARAGNFIGQPVFKQGALGSACPKGSRRNQKTGLCKVFNDKLVRQSTGLKRIG